jgi:PTH1 family peptidyl-tRNA hydrolase
MKLILGLGNNAPEYANTYHNVGFLMLDYLKTQNIDIPLIKLSGFMNEAGEDACLALKKYKLIPEDLLVIHDDSDIALGGYKFSKERGSAGHKGVQNIIDVLGTNNFTRLRIGIRPKETEGHIKAEDFVLKNISKPNLEILNDVFKKAGEELNTLIG